MRVGRRLLFLALAAVAIGLLALRRPGLSSHSPLTEILPGSAYAVACADDRCMVDLDIAAGKRYVLVVGSLAPGTDAHTISLSARPIDAVSVVPADRVEPWSSNSYSTRNSDSLSPARMGGAGQTAEWKGPAERRFYIHVTDGSPDDARQYTAVSAKRVAEGRSVRVYLDSQQSLSEIAPNLADEIVHVFDEQVLPQMAARLGTYRDVDRDGKFTILLSPWLQRLQGGRTSLGGFTREADFRADLERPFSNHCDMIYLNSSLKPDRHLKTLIVHEFTHAVCFSARVAANSQSAGLPAEEDWLNEAIAHISENRHSDDWSNLDYRISRFLSAPNEYPLVIESYYQSGMWRNHGCRGATYLFLRWCADQFGSDLQCKLVHSPATGTRNLEWSTGRPFEELYRRWTIALYESGRGPSTENDQLFASNADEYHSLDLRSQVSNWGLAGPRTETWNLEKSRKIHVRGTSSAYLELEANEDVVARRLFIHGDYGTKLQVSLIAIPDDWPSLNVVADWSDASRERTSLAKDSRRLIVSATADPAIQIERIACEWNYDEVRKPYCFMQDRLQQSWPGAFFSASRVFELEIPSNDEDGTEAEPLIVKVVGRDARGRRATAWAQAQGASRTLQLTEVPANSETR